MGKKSLWIAAGVAAGVASIVFPLAPVGAAPPGQNVTVTNTAASPVPVTGTVNVAGTVPVSGTVNVGSVTGPVPVVPSTPPATASFGIPIQSLTSGSNYTFIDAGYAMKMSSVTIWTRHLVQIAFSGPAPLVITTDEPLAIPLTQPNQTGNSVKVTCLDTTSNCAFQFWMVGS
jgi:hypothetical protein